MLRIMIVDDHGVIRRGVRNLIENHSGWMVCAEASDGQEALETALREKPDIIILEVSLPILGGVAVARILQKESPATRVLLFTTHDDDDTVSSALAAGVRGYILKSDTGENLEAAIAALGANRPCFSS